MWLSFFFFFFFFVIFLIILQLRFTIAGVNRLLFPELQFAIASSCTRRPRNMRHRSSRHIVCKSSPATGYVSLAEHCTSNVVIHLLVLQDNLNTSDFAELTAPLLYDMFKAHSSYPLHLAIQHIREDVVFLFLIEHNAEVT